MRFSFGLPVLPWVAFAVACGAAASPAPLTPAERATIRDDTQAPHLTVALRVALDGPAEQRHVRLVAVTYDMDGQESTTELGSYVGSVIQREAVGAELIRIAIEDGNQQRSLRLVSHEGFIEARHSPDHAAVDVDDELILRIPVREGVRLRVGDPAVEQGE